MLKKNCKFAYMPLRLTTYGRSEDIPSLPGKNVFHSTELFRVLEQTDAYRPLLAVAYDGDEPVGKLLCIVRRKSRWLRISYKTFSYGTGEYFGVRWKPEEVFGEILTYLTRYYGGYSWMVEFRNLEDALFGYRYFRQNGYFPIRWLRVRNSLHHPRIDKWMSQSRRRQIQQGLANGAVMEEVESEADIRSLFTMLDHYYSSKLHHYFPDVGFFLSLLTESSGDKEVGKVFAVRYKGRVIGGSVCLFSNGNAYLLFSGGLRKSFPKLYPGVLAVWKAMLYARDHGYEHFEFMDAGLPFRKLGYRDFILRFGGKQLGSRRWFRISWNWLNRLLIRMYV